MTNVVLTTEPYDPELSWKQEMPTLDLRFSIVHGQSILQQRWEVRTLKKSVSEWRDVPAVIEWRQS